MNSINPSTTMRNLLAGEVALITEMQTWSDEEFDGFDRSKGFILSAGGVARALRQFRQGHVSVTQARTWAEFMQSGCFDGSHPLPTDSLLIEWDPEHPDAVVDAVMRLSELGDLVDGEFRPGEIDQLIAALER